MAANHTLAVEGARVVLTALGVESPAPESMLGSMATLPLPDGPPAPEGQTDLLQQRLFEHQRVEVPIAHWPVPGRRWVRISAQAFNELEDYERLAAALVEELGAG